MTENLVIEKKEEGNQVRYVLLGKIDESSNYESIDLGGTDRIILDFDGVSLINSSGIQRWIAFLEGIPNEVEVDFDNCPLRIINQMNLIPAFTGGRAIIPIAFYAPYYCESCDESFNVRLVTKEKFPDHSNPQTPQVSCERCNGEMEFDGIEKKYFMFMKRSS